MKNQQLTPRQQKKLRKKANHRERQGTYARPLTPDECYCVCHSLIASRAWCSHCEGHNSVGTYHKIKNLARRLKNIVVVNGQA